LELFVIIAMKTPYKLYIKSMNVIVSGMLSESEVKSSQFILKLHLLYINDGGIIIKCPTGNLGISFKAAIKEYIAETNINGNVML
jgi:hypothetical protein